MRVIRREECLRRLGHGGVGRIAVTVGALPAIFPVNYALMDDDVVFRTTPGTKLSLASRSAVVAFEVDEVDPVYHEGWSVMVVGRTEEITEPADLVRAERLPLARWARTGGPESFVRIRSELITGRELVQVPVSLTRI